MDLGAVLFVSLFWAGSYWVTAFTPQLGHRNLAFNRNSGTGSSFVLGPGGVSRLSGGVSRLAGVTEDMNWDPKSGPKLDFGEDFYSVIEVDPAIDQKDLKKAYYKIVFKYHPDNKEGEVAKSLCNKQMMVINNAYKTLKDPALRTKYDLRKQGGVSGTAAKSNPSSASSAAASGVDYGRSRSSSSGQYQYQYQAAVQEPVESLGAILGELWGELRSGGATNLFEDFIDLLEENVPGSRYTSAGVGEAGASSTTTRKSADGQTVAELDSEIAVLSSALRNLQVHLSDLVKLRSQEEQNIQTGGAGGGKSTEVLEARLKKIEALRGLDARIETVQKQTRQLQRQIKLASDARVRKSTQQQQQQQTQRVESTPSDSSFSSPGAMASPAASRRVEIVEEELMILKRSMGLKNK